MKIKNSQIVLVITTFLGVYILLAGYLSILKPSDIKIKEEDKSELEKITEKVVKPLSEEDRQIPKIAPKALSGEINSIFVSLGVLDKNYELKINEGSNVFDLMQQLQNEKKDEFSFKYKEYLDMGVFIYEINGIEGKSGEYWIYYVNGKEASVGVSTYILKEGDSILWKQE